MFFIADSDKVRRGQPARRLTGRHSNDQAAWSSASQASLLLLLLLLLW